MESLNLLDAEEIAGVLSQLNIYGLNGTDSAEGLYVSSKIPFAYNYIDRDLDVAHDHDYAGEHGSHVEGIAAANAYIPTEDGFVNALDAVKVRGVAPDAQIITMKVFGKNGGAYDSDYMIAIEDAILLGADAINLSLGSVAAGTSRAPDPVYQAILKRLENSGTVVSISAGNAGNWVQHADPTGYLYAGDVNLDTVGYPGSLTSVLTVASVENIGYTGHYFTVGQTPIFFSETFNYNRPLTSLQGEQPYILIDGIGSDADWAKVGSALVGKIAICARGEINFDAKASAAVSHGAAATIIYNNVPGVVELDLSNYWYSQPCVSITQADGAQMKEGATPVTDDAGNVLYYEGILTITDDIDCTVYDNAFQTMSDFSSWGVPGSLELKPEITAPGGNIYSVNGLDRSGTAYELMSGTSMASPQVAGMAALVIQYIQENDLAAKTGLTARQLTQSLLMSTAKPVLEEANGGQYYPVMLQGAGEASVGAAINAKSYILMGEDTTKGAADGKVKVELGDDPDRTGTYTFSFSVNNMTDEAQSYTLGADFFTQALFEAAVNYQGETGMFMDTKTAPLSASVAWAVDGKALTPDATLAGLDFDGDGDVDADDGQALLDYAAGVRTQLSNQDKADLDEDGDVDSHDSYLFLTRFSGGVLVVPANGKAEVTVTVTLTDAQKEALNASFKNGAYVEGFVRIDGLTSEDGALGESHSIPVLGFYGNWSDPSMFEVGTVQTYVTGEETRSPYLRDYGVNTPLITYGNDPGNLYAFGGNPLVPDETYMPERNAINSENGDSISKFRISVIRSACASRLAAVNETTGETYAERFFGRIDAAYYMVVWGMGLYFNAYFDLDANVVPVGAAEGDKLRITMSLAPEYYVDDGGQADWDNLGKGTSISVPMVVDNTAPELETVSFNMTNNTLDVVASDNQYIAAVALYNKAGTKLCSYTGAKQDIQPGETAKYSLDLSGINGEKFLLQIHDYAMNVTTWAVEIKIGEGEILPDMLAFDLSYNFWTGFDKNTKYSRPSPLDVYVRSDLSFTAATIVDHMVLAATIDGDLYVMPENDMTEEVVVGHMGKQVSDMAYCKGNDTIYGVADNNLITIDRLTAEVTTIGEIGVTTNTLACDGSGNFYCNQYGTGNVYRFTLQTMDEPELLTADVRVPEGPLVSEYIQSMAISPNDGMLYWRSYCIFWGYAGYSYLIKINPATGAYTVYNDLFDELAALIIPEKSGSSGAWTKPTNEVQGIQISDTSLTVLAKGTRTLTATVQPWTAVDRSVTWISENPAVATVDQSGVVTGVAPGTTTIIATSNLNPSFFATCQVTVEEVNVTLKGALQDPSGNPQFFSWDLKNNETWTAGAAIDTGLISATYDRERELYFIEDNILGLWSIHKVDKNGKTLAQSGEDAASLNLYCMAYSPVFSTQETDKISAVYGYYFLPPQDALHLPGLAFNIASNVGYVVTGMVSLGAERFWDEENQAWRDSEHIVMIDDEGTIFNLWYFEVENEQTGKMDPNIYLNSVTSDLECMLKFDSNHAVPFGSLVVGEDGALYVSHFNGNTNEIYRMTYEASRNRYHADYIGNFGDGVWPAVLTEAVSNDASTGAFVAPGEAERLEAVAVTREELVASAEHLEAGQSHIQAINTQAKGQAAASAAEAPAPTGSLNAVSHVAAPQSQAGKDGKTFTVTITAKDASGEDLASTNGVETVTYDPEVLTLKRIDVHGDFKSVREEAGAVTFGYVSLDGIPAGEAVATLVFEGTSEEAQTITIHHKEANNEHPDFQETLELGCSHKSTEVRGYVAPTCTEDGYTGDTYCTLCGELLAKGEVLPANSESCPSKSFQDLDTNR